MVRRTQFFGSFLLLALFLGFVACGGGKKTVSYDPDPIMDEVETPAPAPVTPAPEPRVVVDEPTRDPLVLRMINFEFDAALLNPAARAILSENARILEQYPEVSVRIEGHCDERGTVEYNLALGERRARTAQDYLVNLGVPQSRLSVISYGKERPLDPRHTPDAWDKNRRAEFVILN